MNCFSTPTRRNWFRCTIPMNTCTERKRDRRRRRRLENILDAYRALNKLKQSGHVTAIGVGSKTWQVVQQIVAEVSLDWVMLANSLTIFRHPLPLLQFVNELAQRNWRSLIPRCFTPAFSPEESFSTTVNRLWNASRKFLLGERHFKNCAGNTPFRRRSPACNLHYLQRALQPSRSIRVIHRASQRMLPRSKRRCPANSGPLPRRPVSLPRITPIWPAAPLRSELKQSAQR